MALPLQRFDFLTHLLVCEQRPLDSLVGAAEGAVGARVDAVVGQVQRRKEYDPACVDRRK
jgi:hypothetical protein